jgi:hypothetical protein
VADWAFPRLAEKPWLKACLVPMLDRTGTEAGALTVAGQWRNFTAFPSILAIAMVSLATAQCSSIYAMEAISMTSTL